jgi:hypothetical protein
VGECGHAWRVAYSFWNTLSGVGAGAEKKSADGVMSKISAPFWSNGYLTATPVSSSPHLILKCLVLWWVSVVMLGVWHTAFGILYQELVLVQIQLTNML